MEENKRTPISGKRYAFIVYYLLLEPAGKIMINPYLSLFFMYSFLDKDIVLMFKELVFN